MSDAERPWLAGLTDRQIRAAGAGDRNILVTAGAGTGKTSVLAARYLHLHLERGVPIGKLLAITFTEKAAAEMRERIAEKLQELGRADSLREIPHAPILTIDSLCFRIVREYGEAVGIEPSSVVLDPVDAEEMEERVWADLLDAWWEGRREDALRLFRALPWKVGADHPGGIDPWPLLSLLRSIRTAGKGLGEVPFVPDLQAERLEVVRSLDALFPEVEALLEAGSTEKTESKLRAILSVRGTPAADRSAAFARARKSLDRTVAKTAKPVVSRAIDLFEAWESLDAEARLETPRRLLSELAGDFRSRFAEEKARRGVVDFLDLEEGALRVLDRPDLAREIRSRYAYLLLDECQDTNELQLRIVERLRNEGRLLAVGDAKQSIYAFRDADVTAFLAMSEKFEGAEERVVLDENFRSRPEILAWVNHLLPALWTENASMQVPYDKLETAEKKVFAPKEVPSVEFLLVQGTKTEALREREAALLARRLRAIHRERLDDLRYGDMAILFRSTSDLQTYEHALRAHGIPTAVAVGRGFFQTREVIDLLSGFSLVDDPFDDLVLAGALRSPLAGIADADLVELLAGRRPGAPPLWEEIRGGARLASLSPDGRARLSRFAEILEELRALRGRVPSHRLLERLARETRYIESYLLLPEGLRYRANIRKLLELARALEDRAEVTIPEAIRTLRRYRTTRTREAESALDVERDAVRLLTIHGAKGMEFPLVAVVDLGRRPRADRPDFLFEKERGVGLRERTEGSSSEKKPRLYAEIEAGRRRLAEAEEVRLLYVSLTRAERHLILSGCRTEKAAGWLARILEAVPIPEEPGVHRIGDAVLRVLEATAPPEKEKRPVLPARVVSRPERYGARADRDEVERIARRLELRPPAPAGDEDGRTVTGAALFARCPRRYDLARRFPLPEAERTSAGDAGAAPSAARAGTAFHALMDAHWKGLASLPREDEEHLLWKKTLLALPEMRPVLDAPFREAEASFVSTVGGRPLRGVIDLLAVGEPGAVVIDYKTDRAAPEEILARYRLSANLYRLAVRAIVPRAPRVEVLLYAARAGRLLVAAGEGAAGGGSGPGAPDGEEEALALLAECDRAERERVFAARENATCPSCPHRRRCPAFAPSGVAKVASSRRTNGALPE